MVEQPLGAAQTTTSAVWKRSRELMAKGIAPEQFHTIGHVTNCQVLPYSTWWDATVGVEQPGPWIPDEKPSPAEIQKALAEWNFVILPGPSVGKSGTPLPFPPDYLRAMEGGRMAGLISDYLHPIRNRGRFRRIRGSASADQRRHGPDPAGPPLCPTPAWAWCTRSAAATTARPPSWRFAASSAIRLWQARGKGLQLLGGAAVCYWWTIPW